MTFEIEVNGTPRTVSVERAGASPTSFRVTVDGAAHVLDAERVGDFGLSMVLPGDGHASVTVELAPAGATGEMLARFRGATAAVVVNGRRTSHAGADAADAHGEQRIAAPMPGRVVRVLVAAGDEVDARQPLVVVEAMKMENELRSPRAGRIKEVSVEAGMSVEAGRVLVIVE
ncbi:MAG TPA: biotin/lipoyl-containing protein [Vicinamibacterales bacterium]|nr:biotin/lipoyl-containing protein [Vicinamibacterales bacterium]